MAARAARLFDVPVVLISLVDESRQWIKACVGVDLTQTDRSISFCTHALDSNGVFQVPDALTDPRFATNPLVLGDPHIRFYAGAPLKTPGGESLGTLCLIDRTARLPLTLDEQLTLQELAEDVIRELELARALRETRATLLEYELALHRQRRSEAVTSGILQFAMDAVVIMDEEGVVIEWNPAAEELFGYSYREALGQTLAPLILPEEIHATYAQRIARFLSTGDSRIIGRRLEISALRRDGRAFPCELSLTSMNLGGERRFTAYFRDLTERQAANEAAITSHNLLRAVFDTVPESIFVKDTAGRYVMINAAGAAIIGQPVEAILGKTDWDLFPAPTADHSTRQDAIVWQTDEPQRYEVTDLLADGTSRNFLSTKSVYRDARGQVQGLIGAAVDVTELKVMETQLQVKNAELEAHVQARTSELEEARLEMLERLARAAEHRDEDTGEHVHRVARTSRGIAVELGLTQEDVDLIGRASPLHDVGKIGVRDAILLKPGRLTPEEFEEVKAHTTIGASILDQGRSALIQVAQEIALTHHERWDGAGYPARLAGQEIPLCGRIVAVADVFDALTSERPYKRAWTREAALEEIRAQAGRQFDPHVVRAFERWLRDEPPTP